MENVHKPKPQIEQPKSGSYTPSIGTEQMKKSPVTEDLSTLTEDEYSGLEMMKGVQFQHMDKIVVGIAGLKNNSILFAIISGLPASGMLTSVIEILKFYFYEDNSNTHVDSKPLLPWFIILVVCFVIILCIIPLIGKNRTENDKNITMIKDSLCAIYKQAKEKNKTMVIINRNNNIDFEASRNKYLENEGKNKTNKSIFQEIIAKLKAIILLVLLSVSSIKAFAQLSYEFPQYVTNGSMKVWSVLSFVIILLIIIISILSMLRSMQMRREVELLSKKILL